MSEDKRKRKLNDLKSFSVKICLNIYNDFESYEIINMPQSVQEAWKLGREIFNLNSSWSNL